MSAGGPGAGRLEPDGIASLIRRLERMSWNPAGRDEHRLVERQRVFRAWLALPPEGQLADLRAYWREAGRGGRSAPALEHFQRIAPPSASETERRWFGIGLEVALTALRNENGPGPELSRCRVGQMIELARQLRGNVSRKEAGNRIGRSAGLLGRLFVVRTGSSFRRFCLGLRVLTALQLLKDLSQPIESVSRVLGYAGAGCFDRAFRRVLGMRPGGFRKRMGR